MNEPAKNLQRDLTGILLRLTLGAILFPHGAQKMFGWFNGPGPAAEIQHLTHEMHLPLAIAVLVILTEFFGSICLLIGLFTRFWSLAFIVLFIGIIFTAHLEHGFFMNWFGTQKGEGFEYHLLVIGSALSLLINGSGKFTITHLVSTALNKQ